MDEDRGEEEEGRYKTHEEIDKSTKTWVVKGEVTLGKAPGHKAKDDKPGVVQGYLDAKDLKEFYATPHVPLLVRSRACSPRRPWFVRGTNPMVIRVDTEAPSLQVGHT